MEKKLDEQQKLIHADPTKDFFVKMITRDIALQDCIFDLLDNSIDGARRCGGSDGDKPLQGYFAKISFDKNGFSISDNCGGIRLSDAINYAFHFGRRPKSPADVGGGIGLYGIGMKRAIFKIGRVAEVISKAEDASFNVLLNVDEWEKRPDWDFEYEIIQGDDCRGTVISVNALNPGIDDAFGDPVFSNELIRMIARDYAFFIEKGFEIHVGGTLVPSYKYQLRSNENMEPASMFYEDEGVSIRVVAGLIDDLPDEVPESLSQKDVERYGWYVVCNDRIVLAADKTNNTIWGDDSFKVWHPQYNGFAGFVFFQAEDQGALPWTTTKRAVEGSNPLYRRTLRVLKDVTEKFISYTNQRKNDIEAARNAEKPSQRVDVYVPKPQPTESIRELKFPKIVLEVPADPLVNITYKRRESEINEIRLHLGKRSISNRDVGNYTFDYFREMELGK